MNREGSGRQVSPDFFGVFRYEWKSASKLVGIFGLRGGYMASVDSIGGTGGANRGRRDRMAVVVLNVFSGLTKTYGAIITVLYCISYPLG